jgi:hypothetical protein
MRMGPAFKITGVDALDDEEKEALTDLLCACHYYCAPMVNEIELHKGLCSKCGGELDVGSLAPVLPNAPEEFLGEYCTKCVASFASEDELLAWARERRVKKSDEE